jgi:hypothetical protein
MGSWAGGGGGARSAWAAGLRAFVSAGERYVASQRNGCRSRRSQGACVCVCMCMHVHVHVHMHIYMYTHLYTYLSYIYISCMCMWRSGEQRKGRKQRMARARACRFSQASAANDLSGTGLSAFTPNTCRR